jgi:hypothetical protein
VRTFYLSLRPQFPGITQSMRLLCDSINTSFVAVAKPLISPTNLSFLNPEKPAIFDFNHRCEKLEMTVDCVDGFIYPEHIRKIAIFGFLSIYRHRMIFLVSGNYSVFIPD